MIIYERTVNTKSDTRYEKICSQAAINSDGRITIRNFNPDDNSEVMTVLSRTETRAIFELMKEIGSFAKTDLPF